MLLYFIHYKQTEKHAYRPGAVQGPLKEELEELLAQKQSEYTRLKMFEDIMQQEKPTSIGQLFEIAINTKNTDILKKYQLILTKIVDENRRYCYDKNIKVIPKL